MLALSTADLAPTQRSLHEQPATIDRQLTAVPQPFKVRP